MRHFTIIAAILFTLAAPTWAADAKDESKDEGRSRPAPSPGSSSAASARPSPPAASATSPSTRPTRATTSWLWPRAGSGRRSTTAPPGRRSSTARAPTRSAASTSTRRTPTSSGSARGENNSQRTVSFGDGVYKSLDGGKSWKNMGLERLRAHRHDRHRPARLRRRLRRRPGPAVAIRRRPRALQDHRRRRDLGARPRDQRGHRRQRGAPRPARPGRPLRLVLPAAAPRLDPDQRRSRVGASTSRPTAAPPGARSTRACRRWTWAASASTSRRPTPTCVYAIVEAARGEGRLLPLHRPRRDLEASAPTTSPAARSTTTRSSPTRKTSTASTPSTPGCRSPRTAARRFSKIGRPTATSTTTPCGSTRRTPTTCWSAATAASTRAGTGARPRLQGEPAAHPVLPRRHRQLASPSTTSTAAPRTTPPSAARRAPPAQPASPTRTGSSPSSATASRPGWTPRTRRSSTASGSTAAWCATTAAAARSSTSSRRQPPGEEPYRWNWDAPLIISPHSHTRLYFAASRLFRSDDRGN